MSIRPRGGIRPRRIRGGRDVRRAGSAGSRPWARSCGVPMGWRHGRRARPAPWCQPADMHCLYALALQRPAKTLSPPVVDRVEAALHRVGRGLPTGERCSVPVGARSRRFEVALAVAPRPRRHRPNPIGIYRKIAGIECREQARRNPQIHEGRSRPPGQGLPRDHSRSLSRGRDPASASTPPKRAPAGTGAGA